MKRLVVAALMLAFVGVSFSTLAIGQSINPATTTATPALAANQATSKADMDAERAKKKQKHNHEQPAEKSDPPVPAFFFIQLIGLLKPLLHLFPNHVAKVEALIVFADNN